MYKSTLPYLGWVALLCLAAAGAAWAQEMAEPEKLDLTSIVSANREEVVQTDKDQASEGDKKTFVVKTDKDITSLEVGDEYRNGPEGKTFFKVTEVSSKSSDGGVFKIERTRGKEDPDPLGQMYVKVSGKGPLEIIKRDTPLDYYNAGGAFLHPIAVLMIIMFVMAANSIWIYRRQRQLPASFIQAASEALDRGDVAQVHKLSTEAHGLFPLVCRAMTERYEACSMKEIRGRVDAMASLAVTRLRIPAKALNLIAVAAPLMGLFGTIVGMVIVFNGLAHSMGAKHASQQLADGIRLKLFSTAFALMVAIPSLFLFFIFNQRLNTLVAEAERLAEDFLQRLAAVKRKKGGRGAADEDDEDEVGAEKHASATV